MSDKIITKKAGLFWLTVSEVSNHAHSARFFLDLVVRLNITVQRVEQSCPPLIGRQNQNQGQGLKFPS